MRRNLYRMMVSVEWHRITAFMYHTHDYILTM